jgi:hypothetical protein
MKIRRIQIGGIVAAVALSLSVSSAVAGVAGASPSAKLSAHAASTVTPGAFCSPAGAVDKTVTGVAMKCTTAPGDSRNRWRVK